MIKMTGQNYCEDCGKPIPERIQKQKSNLSKVPVNTEFHIAGKKGKKLDLKLPGNKFAVLIDNKDVKMFPGNTIISLLG